MKLSGITPESVQQAIQLIDQKKLSAAQVKSEFQVLVDNRSYPFKLLVETAYRIATGAALPAGTFKEYFYLIKQFEEFTGFKVKVSSPILFRKRINSDLHVILCPSILLQSCDQAIIDLSHLGPEMNDPEIKKRKFRNEVGYDDIEPGELFFLVTDRLLYGLVQVVADDSVTPPLVPVQTIFLLQPAPEHGIDLEEERYPIFECQFYGLYFKELIAVLDRQDPEIVSKIIERLQS